MARDTPVDPVLTTTVSEVSEIDVAVVIAVSDVLGVAPDDLDEVLYDVIDPDALCYLIESSKSLSVTFEFNGYTVTVDTDGRVSITE